ncbi:hypothetical protein APSETT444_003805 [Aspergillus pseudonomiae]
MSSVPDHTDSAKPAIEWQFIDASNNSRSNLTQVKRHVMQQYMRQKRASGQPSDDAEQTVVESHSAPRKSTRRPRKGRTSTGDTAQKGKEEGVNSQRQKNVQSSSAQRSKVKVAPNKDSMDDLVEEIERDFGPGVIASAETRTDPFNSLPMDLDAEGQRLFDFYVNEMPACSYGSHFRSAKAHNWYTAVFVPEGMKGAVTFQNTILVHAANTWAWVRNEEETDYTLVHRNRAISMLRDHMTRNPGDISDVAIIACLSAAGLEDFDPRPGHKEISWVHMRAAREMIRARGGPAAFENTRLGMLINWQDYILSGYETNGLSFFFEYNPSVKQSFKEPSQWQDSITQTSNLTPSPLPSMPLLSPGDALSHSALINPSNSLTFLSPEDEIRHQCDEFIDFLKRCEELSISHRSNRANTPASVRYTAFQETSLLYSILAAPPGLRFTASGNRKQFVARLVALIMLNAALWDYRNSVQHSETFLWTLEQAVLASEVDTSGSVEALLQIMLECNDGITTPDMSSTSLGAQGVPDFTQYSPAAKTQYGRPWFAGRMLKVAKRLSLNSWMIVHDFLFSCLTLCLETPVSLWERELRQEILSAPLTSYIMPALAE